MKFDEVKELVRKSAGYRVAFEKVEGGRGGSVSDCFPEADEDTIPNEEAAWHWARLFAKAGKDKGIVNVYVVHGDDYQPVEGYQDKKLNPYTTTEKE